jgi:hypothetical protein
MEQRHVPILVKERQGIYAQYYIHICIIFYSLKFISENSFLVFITFLYLLLIFSFFRHVMPKAKSKTWERSIEYLK